MRKVWIYILAGLGVVVLFGITFMFGGMGTVKNLKIGNVTAGGIPDGTYQGQYRHGRWRYSVNVTVKDHKITAVTFADNNPLNQATSSITDELTARVIAKGTPDVDAVSGATVTSKAFLKAVENALTSAPK